MRQTEMLRKEDVERKWYVIDAEDIPLGRLATRVASVLSGKQNPFYTPHIDSGDYVIVINADKIKLTGNKWEDKKYYRHSGYPGGLKAEMRKKLWRSFQRVWLNKQLKVCFLKQH